MNRLRFSWIAMSLILTAGCDEVWPTGPLGEEIAMASREDWEGVWIGAESAVTVQVMDEKAGVGDRQPPPRRVHTHRRTGPGDSDPGMLGVSMGGTGSGYRKPDSPGNSEPSGSDSSS